MFTAILSALNIFGGFLFRSVIAKFFSYFILYFFVTEAIQLLMSANIFPNSNSLNTVLLSFSKEINWGLHLMAFDVVFPMILGAYATRYVISMIPIIGPKT